MKGICVLGSTGSIGVNTLDVIARHPKLYRAVALTANKNVDKLYDQCLTHKPDFAVLVDEAQAQRLERRLLDSGVSGITVLGGRRALEEVVQSADIDSVMAAIVGSDGLMPTLAAVRSGKCVLLANKEALVMSGDVFMQEIARSGAQLLPIDSEHNAIFQCMPPNYRTGDTPVGVRRILLTASGGPFRTTPLDQLAHVTPEQAVAHPNWVMGRKISVDSATMMNKGLELIEATLLFAVPDETIDIVIHPQSVIHSMVDYTDGTVLAQLGNPDMRIPIAHALAWPDRFESGAEPLNLFDVKSLDFEPPDETRFPCLRLARQAARAGGAMPTVLNSANEVAVAAFLGGRIAFIEIDKVIEKTLDSIPQSPADTIERVLELDRKTRQLATNVVEQLSA